MSGEKVARYTAAQMEAMARTLHYSGTDEFSDEATSMLAQAAQTEADVAGLLEAIKALLPWAESASYGGPDIEADIEQARTALARFQP